MQKILTEIEINVPARTVWETLVDLGSYAEWNPFIREASGQVAVGQILTLRLFPVNGKPMTFRPRVLTADPGSELRWVGRLFVPGIFDGEHSFTLTSSTPVRTQLVQAEAFSGVLVPFTKGVINNTKTSFVELNEALKERLES